MAIKTFPPFLDVRFWLLAAGCALVSCQGGKIARAYPVNTGGLASRGKQVIVMKGCGSCHTIPGINGAQGLVGPP